MGNGRKRPPNRSRSRGSSGPSNRGLFIEGGLLSDWSPFNSPPSRGRANNKSGKNKSSRSNSNGKGSTSDSKTRLMRPCVGPQNNTTKGNTIRYVYPQDCSMFSETESRKNVLDESISKPVPLFGETVSRENVLGSLESNPVVLIDSEKTPIVVYMDEGPVRESKSVEYLYDYTTSFTVEESEHRGLGFCEGVEDVVGSSSKVEGEEDGATDVCTDAEEDDVFMDDDENDESDEESEVPEKGRGYVVIAGTRIYTEDTSDGDDDEGEDVSDDESSDSDDETSESGDSSFSGSVDDEIAEDYFEGIGGIEDVVNVDRLVGKKPNYQSDSDDGFRDTIQKLGGIALQDASREYGLMNPGMGKKYRVKDKKPGNGGNNGWSTSFDDLMFVKDPRTVSGRKKHVSKFPQSWPSESSKRKNFRRIPGEKKKHHKETIAVKRRDRMLRRGVDLQKINSKLQQIVLDGVDIFSFQPMDSRDCSQVRKLAAIYRLQSGIQGSGRKRFVTVIQTRHTSMPSATDAIRLEKLIGPDDDADFSIVDRKPIKMNSKYTPTGSKSSKQKSDQNSSNKPASKESRKNKKSGAVGSYAAQPLSFVSSGILNADTDEVKKIDSSEIKELFTEVKSTPNSVEYSSFELHTTGFGSKMMAKMGYVEGSGLGKEGQGMAKPIEVFQRPKSLGLGANVPEASDKTPIVESRMKPMRRDPKSSGTSEKSRRDAKSSRTKEKSTRRGAKSSGTNERSARKEIPKMGSFERHTKGFGSKIMAQMGFVEGAGLGKDAQGIVTPLVAVRRPKARGLGSTS